MAEKVLFSWSSGKDSSLALWEISKDPAYKVIALMSTITADYNRVSMHGTRTELLERQAIELGIQQVVVSIYAGGSNEDYEKAMGKIMQEFKARGVNTVAIGDIFLEDLRIYREEKLAQADMTGIFPIWKRDTSELAQTFIDNGFRAVVTCVDTEQLDGSFSGREYDESFIKDLPAGVDPCGENGEFHTFCYDGPMFRNSVRFKIGKSVLREEQFMFTDLMPVSG